MEILGQVGGRCPEIHRRTVGPAEIQVAGACPAQLVERDTGTDHHWGSFRGRSGMGRVGAHQGLSVKSRFGG